MSSVAFPYPVLGRYDDYIGVEFQVAFELDHKESETNDSDHSTAIDFAFDLSDETILKQIESKNASFGFEIVCASTNRRWVELTDSSGRLPLDTKILFGEVKFYPRVFVVEEIQGFCSPAFNPEFDSNQYDLFPGDVLATADPNAIWIQFKPLNMKSVIKVFCNEESKFPFAYEFNLEGPTIQIVMGKYFWEKWNLARNSSEKKPIFIMSVYKDCMVAALELIVQEDYEPEQIWAKALMDALEKRKIQLPDSYDFIKLNEIAQILLSDKGIMRLPA